VAADQGTLEVATQEIHSVSAFFVYFLSLADGGLIAIKL
jgi:hypothetical protein